MPIPSTILIPLHPCISIDIHQNVPPPPAPPVPPFLPYFWVQVLGGLPLVNKAKMATTTFTWYFPAMQKGTDIGRFLIHVGNPVNLKLPFIIIGSGSKSFFGASTVKASNEPVATSLLIIINKNMNCCDPCNLPAGNVIAPNTVLAGMTIGDYFGGIVNALIDTAVSFAIGHVAGKFGDGIADCIGKSGLAQAAWNTVISDAFSDLFKSGVDLGREGLKNLTGFDSDTDQIGDYAGSALDDTGISETLFGDSDSTSDSTDSGLDATNNYYNDSELIA